MTDEPARPSRRARQPVQQKQPNFDTWEAVNDDEPPADPARIRFYVVAFDGEGQSIDGEAIDTDGLDAREFLATDKRRRAMAPRSVAATNRLVARLQATAEPA